jgi:hypothetical protein
VLLIKPLKTSMVCGIGLRDAHIPSESIYMKITTIPTNITITLISIVTIITILTIITIKTIFFHKNNKNIINILIIKP